MLAIDGGRTIVAGALLDIGRGCIRCSRSGSVLPLSLRLLLPLPIVVAQDIAISISHDIVLHLLMSCSGSLFRLPLLIGRHSVLDIPSVRTADCSGINRLMDVSPLVSSAVDIIMAGIVVAAIIPVVIDMNPVDIHLVE